MNNPIGGRDITSAPSPRFGAKLLDANLVEFSLWAPNAKSIGVILEGAVHSMHSDASGLFQAQIAARAGTRYKYVVDGELQVPDPASRAQQGDVEGESIVVDHGAFDWTNREWKGRPWHEAVICEVHVGLLGGFEGVRMKLAGMAECGYTAIELMPVAEFPGARNWGYDGVLLYAPEASYGSPDQLKALIDEAHALGLMVLLDVVYNHFGPDGNYLPTYASEFFRKDGATPWGQSIDFTRPQVQTFYIDNALMWLNDYRFDGIRFDAVHAIAPESFLLDLCGAIRKGTDATRHIHLVLENEHNAARLLRGDFDGQWDDDAHNSLHALLTGESEAYYADFAADPTALLARVLAEGFAFQGQPDRRGKTRGEPSGDLSPQSFVFFLQNHDQVGNRPLGDRLIQNIELAPFKVATALVALCPMVPLFFMGDEWGCRTPFLFFTSHREELAEKVRDGRRSEFSQFSGFSDETQRDAIPDPNAPATYEMSRPAADSEEVAGNWRKWFAGLLELRSERLTPYLPGSSSLGCDVLGVGALRAKWRLGNGSVLSIAFNLGTETIEMPFSWSDEDLIYSVPPRAATGTDHGMLPPASLLACVEPAEL